MYEAHLKCERKLKLRPKIGNGNALRATTTSINGPSVICLLRNQLNLLSQGSSNLRMYVRMFVGNEGILPLANGHINYTRRQSSNRSPGRLVLSRPIRCELCP